MIQTPIRFKEVTVAVIVVVISISLVLPSVAEKTTWTKNVVYDQLDQQNSNWDGGNVGTNFSLAQSFQPRLKNLTKVELLMFNVNNPIGNLTISIRENLSGSDLTSVTVRLETLPQFSPPPGEWKAFDFPDIKVIPGQTYYIVSSHDPLLPYNLTFWAFSGPPDPYRHGQPWAQNPDMSWDPFNPTRVDFCFRTYGYGYSNDPPNQPTIKGPRYGTINTNYTFSLGTVTDPDGDMFYCRWDWGNGNISEWLGLFDSGTPISNTQSWNTPGDYSIRAQLMDSHGYESNWSEPFTIHIVSLKRALFTGTYLGSFESPDDITVLQGGLFFIIPSDLIVYHGTTIVISKRYHGYQGKVFIIGIGGIAVLP